MALLDDGAEGADGNEGGGNDGGGFIASLPEELRGDANLANFKDVGSLAKSYIETKKLVGDPAVLRPPKDADDVRMKEWRDSVMPKLKELGFIESAPESPDKYEFKFEGLSPEDTKADPVLKAWRESAHRMGLSNAQAQAVAEAFVRDIAPAMLPKLPTEEDAKAELAKEFGSRLNEKVAAARRAVSAIEAKSPGFKAWLEDKSRGWLGNDPVFITTMALVGDMMSQDFGGAAASIPAGETLESIDNKIREVRNDTTLTDDGKGAKLEPLYKIKSAMLKMRDKK